MRATKAVHVYYCNHCHNYSQSANMKGNGWIELFLWLSIFFLAIIYSIWRRAGPPNVCPLCKTAGLVPAGAAKPIATEQLNDKREEFECPFCAEKILAKAVICKHCGKTVPPKPTVDRIRNDTPWATAGSAEESIDKMPLRPGQVMSRVSSPTSPTIFYLASAGVLVCGSLLSLNVAILAVVVCAVALIIGFISPKILKLPSRVLVVSVLGAGILVSFVIAGSHEYARGKEAFASNSVEDFGIKMLDDLFDKGQYEEFVDGAPKYMPYRKLPRYKERYAAAKAKISRAQNLPPHRVNDTWQQGDSIMLYVVADSNLSEKDARRLVEHYREQNKNSRIVNVDIFCSEQYASSKYMESGISDEKYYSHVSFSYSTGPIKTIFRSPANSECRRG